MKLASGKFGAAKNRRVVAIDLGGQTSKAVYLEKTDAGFSFLNYHIQDFPFSDQNFTSEALAEHLAAIHQALGSTTKRTVLALSQGTGILRQIEMMEAQKADLRQMLQVNSFHYLQQNLSDYVFDCDLIGSKVVVDPPREVAAGDEKEKPPAPETKLLSATSSSLLGSKRAEVLAAGITRKVLSELQLACLKAGLLLEEVTFSQLALLTAAWYTMPGEWANDTLAFVDIGFLSTDISILKAGRLSLTRVLNFGADRITKGLAESLAITYPVAEGIKLTMPDKVKAKLQKIIYPLIEELRASVSFFEEQNQTTITHLYLSGGSARSEVILQILNEELAAPQCHRWDPVAFLHPPAALQERLVRDAFVLGGAVGAAVGHASPSVLRVNLLAQQLEEAELRRRDPVRKVIRAAVLLGCLLLIWATYLGLLSFRKSSEMSTYRARLELLHNDTGKVTDFARRAAESERSLSRVLKQASNRFLWTQPLNALQYCMVPGIQVVRLSLSQNVATVGPLKPETDADGNKVSPGKPASRVEKISLIITAKDYGDPPAVEQFIASVTTNSYFKTQLRKVNPIILRDRLSRQVDPLDTSRSFIPIIIECVFEERSTTDE